jgi:hypothetical protein
MNTIKKSRLWLLAIVPAGLLISVALWHSQAGSVKAIDCSGDWYNSTDRATLNACGSAQNAQKVMEEQTAIAQKEQEPYYQTIPDLSPVVLLPEPDDAKTIQQFPLHQSTNDPNLVQALPHYLDGATSYWQIGSIPNSDYTDWSGAMVATYPGNGAGDTYLYTNEGNPILDVFGYDGTDAGAAKYSPNWTCPKAIGKIDITDIVVKTGATGMGADPPNFSGLNYIVYFTNDGAYGGTVTGNFDMTTGTWTFDPPTSPRYMVTTPIPTSTSTP